jgi:hypothetical protein
MEAKPSTETCTSGDGLVAVLKVSPCAVLSRVLLSSLPGWVGLAGTMAGLRVSQSKPVGASSTPLRSMVLLRVSKIAGPIQVPHC